MRRFGPFALVAFAACSRDAPAAAPDSLGGAFEPTAFTVSVHGEGRPIIFIPGLGCPGDLWDDTVAHLGDGYQAHVLTLAGFAGVPRIDGPLNAETREQLAHYIRAHKLKAPVIVGHSMGGFLAYWLAATEPTIVGPTIVVESGTAVGEGDKAANAATGAQVRAMWANAGDYEYVAQVRDIFGSMAAHRERLVPFLDEIEKSDRKALGDAIYEQYTTDIRSTIKHITVPVLVVLADGSLAPNLRKQAEAVPHHQVVQIPNAKHFVMLDEPEAFYAALDAFLGPVVAEPAEPAVEVPAPAPVTAVKSAVTPAEPRTVMPLRVASFTRGVEVVQSAVAMISSRRP